jgi:hypothetical protein
MAGSQYEVIDDGRRTQRSAAPRLFQVDDHADVIRFHVRVLLARGAHPGALAGIFNTVVMNRTA